MTPSTPGTAPSARALNVLVDTHRSFLEFLEGRLGDRALAEDILQSAFVKGIDKLATLEDEESAVAWFYRVLRNEVNDHYRRRAAAGRKLDALARESPLTTEPDAGAKSAVCRCVGELASTLKPEYAEALRRVEVDGISVKSYASEAGITANNAAVRVFRARQALRQQVSRACGTCAEHGCLDCSCGARVVPNRREALTPELVYKIFRREEFDDLRRSGVFAGSPDDLRDGFIHLSCADQVAGTLERHFPGAAGLVVAEVDTRGMQPELRMETSRHGQAFPHLYRPLRLEDLRRHFPAADFTQRGA